MENNKVYALKGIVDYEGEDIIAIFSSFEKAKEFWDSTYELRESKHHGQWFIKKASNEEFWKTFALYDAMEIDEMTIDETPSY